MTTRDFVCLSPLGNPTALTRNAYAAAVETWLCRGCGRPKPSIGAVDVQIRGGPYDLPLSFVSGTGIMLIHRDPLSALHSDNVARDLLVGAVLNHSNTAISDWLTVRGRRRLIVRGSEDASYRQCDICDRIVYFAMGEEYLFPEPPADASLYESDLSLVVTCGAIKNEAALKGWPRLEVKKLKVLGKPKDSLGELM